MDNETAVTKENKNRKKLARNVFDGVFIALLILTVAIYGALCLWCLRMEAQEGSAYWHSFELFGIQTDYSQIGWLFVCFFAILLEFGLTLRYLIFRREKKWWTIVLKIISVLCLILLFLSALSDVLQSGFWQLKLFFAQTVVPGYLAALLLRLITYCIFEGRPGKEKKV